MIECMEKDGRIIVTGYDFITSSEVKLGEIRDTEESEGESFWVFFPVHSPLNCGQLKRLFIKLSELNRDKE